MKDGERNPRATLAGLDPTSARAASEILHYVTSPELMGAPPVTAPFMLAYAAETIQNSDARGLGILLDAGLPCNQILTIGPVGICFPM